MHCNLHHGDSQRSNRDVCPTQLGAHRHSRPFRGGRVRHVLHDGYIGTACAPLIWAGDMHCIGATTQIASSATELWTIPSATFWRRSKHCLQKAMSASVHACASKDNGSRLQFQSCSFLASSVVAGRSLQGRSLLCTSEQNLTIDPCSHMPGAGDAVFANNATQRKHRQDVERTTCFL